ncbi:MAG: hypothetical protein H7246_09170 [Phycisphaerae bacterium]|nr:hypothetical protein [Saprospiraceae bacterium]
MNPALRIVLFVNLLLIILACSEASQPKSPDASLSPPPTMGMVEIFDSTIPQKLPLLRGAWKGIGPDRGRSFLWTVTNGRLEGTYSANKKVKEDYTKMFRFWIEGGAICCFPGTYGGKCGTPDGTYVLTEQTDSSYTFVSDRRPVPKTVSTLKFSFVGQNQMAFQWKHDYGDYPDRNIVRHFQKS